MNVLITGAAQGLGEALTKEFARRGAAVGALDLLWAEAETVPSSSSWRRRLDVADPTAWEQLASELTESGWIPDVLINNAGVGVYGSVAQISVEAWQQQLDVSLSGPWFGLKYLSPVMASGGKILNIGSHRAVEAAAERSAYCAAKFGLRGLTLAVAAELAPHLQVGIVELGAMLTNFAGDLERKQAQQRQGEPFLDPHEAATEIGAMISGERPWQTEWLMRATGSGTEIAPLTQSLW